MRSVEASASRRIPRTAGDRVPRGTPRVPAALLALLGAVLILGVAWTLITPALEAPDENSHFGYVQHFAETGSLPGSAAGPMFSTEQSVAASASNADQAAASLPTKMEWSARVYRSWRRGAAREPARVRADGGGPNPASSNPPLYYVYEAGAYRIAEGADFFGRLEAARLASVLWLLVTVGGVWLLAGEVFARDRLLQLTAAGFAGLAPMTQFVSATVTPDAMLFAIWSLALWLGVRVIKRDATPRMAAALAATIGIGIVVKATSYALLPAGLLALAIGLWRSRSGGRRVGIATGGSAAAGIAATAGGWILAARLLHRAAAAQVNAVATGATFNLRQFLSYVWQFYLPRLSFQTPFPVMTPTIPVWDVWFKGAWAAFGWLEIQFPEPVYWLLLLVFLVVLGFAAAGAWARRGSHDWWVAAFLALAVLALIGGLHWTEYRQVKSGAGSFNQGRYLLPLVGVAGVIVAQAAASVRAQMRARVVAVGLGTMLALDLCSLGLVLERFYA